MNWLDIAILAVMAVTLFFGLRIGIIKAVLSLAGLIVGIILAGRYYLPLAERLTFIPQDIAFFPQASLAEIAAFAFILGGTMIIATVAAVLLKWTASMVMLGWVNRLGGAIFGLLLGGLLCSALLAIWSKFLGITGVISESSLAVILLNRFPAVLALLPGEFDAIRSFFQ